MVRSVASRSRRVFTPVVPRKRSSRRLLLEVLESRINPSPSGVTIGNPVVVEPTSGQTAQLLFVVTANGTSDDATTVYYHTGESTGDAANTATAGVDYCPTSGSITFAPGPGFATIAVTVRNSNLLTDKQVTMDLGIETTDPDGDNDLLPLGTPSQGIGTIEAPVQPPTISVSPNVATDGSGNAVSNSQMVTVSGTAEPDSSVNVSVSGPDGYSTSASAPNTNGAWSLTFQNLSDGVYTFSATQTDQDDGEVSTAATIGVLVDTSENLKIGGARNPSNQATLGSDTNVTRPTLFGIANPGSTVCVSVSGTTASDSAFSETIGNTTAGSDGTWSVPFQDSALSLPDGNYTFTVNATDLAGYTAQQTRELTIDTVPPNAPILTGLTNSQGQPDNPITNNNTITNDTTPTLNGTAEVDSTVNVSVSGTTTTGASFSESLGPTIATDGTWSVALAPEDGHLADGTYTITATATDAAGNTSTPSSALSLTIDTSPPVVTGVPVEVFDNAPGDIQATVATFTDPDHNQPVSSYTAVITWADGSTSDGMVTANNNKGGFDVTATIPKMTDQPPVSVSVTDAAGNIGTAEIVSLSGTTGAVTAVGTEWKGVVAFGDSAISPTDTLSVDYGDGKFSNPLSPDSNGQFSLSHTWDSRAFYTVTVSLNNSSGQLLEQATFKVVVLGATSQGDVAEFIVATTPPGQHATLDLSEPNTTLTLNYDTGTTDVVSCMCLYKNPPVAGAPQGLYLDFQLLNPQTAKVSNLTLTVSASLLDGNATIGFYDPKTGLFINLKHDSDVTLTQDEATGTVIITFHNLDFLTGTIFSATLPSTTGTTTTATVQPATAQVGATPSPASTAASVTFTSSTQLTLPLSASQNSQLSTDATARGSQANATSSPGAPTTTTTAQLSSSASGTANGGGENRMSAEEEEAFWNWLQEHGLDLWFRGVALDGLLETKTEPAPAQTELPAHGLQASVEREPESVASEVRQSSEPAREQRTAEADGPNTLLAAALIGMLALPRAWGIRGMGLSFNHPLGSRTKGSTG